MNNAKTGISKKIPHAYIQGGIRYYALMREVKTTADDSEVSAFNFYVFDESGYVWLQMTHTVPSFINQIGNGLFRERYVLEVDDTIYFSHPLVTSNTWIDGVPDRGYALEIIREGLGLDLECMTTIMEALNVNS